MIKLTLVILLFILISGCAVMPNSKKGDMTFHLTTNGKLEALLIHSEFDEAKFLLDKTDSSLKNNIYEWLRVADYVDVAQYERAMKYLKHHNMLTSRLEDVNENPSNYEGKYDIYKKKCADSICKFVTSGQLNQYVPSNTPFSNIFKQHIINKIDALKRNFTLTRDKLRVIANTERKEIEKLELLEQERLVKIKKERKRKLRIEAEAKQLRQQQIREAEQRELDQARALKIGAETKIIEGLVKKGGYLKYHDIGILHMIYQTQRKGGLEKYVNTVIGCRRNNDQCDKPYQKFQIIQIADDGVLYSYSEPNGDDWVDVTVFVKKQPGVLYQEGQIFENALYSFKGTINYTTIFGAIKTVPYFVFLTNQR